ncbi:hypothetical protein [Methanosalsum natronophilum]|uniref:hypothetical protein n=1 Tax=Methanosalsum natronophilum TaxID=768733 RepID=UPI002167E160|nr:hypothetical protein [Methanosalsum natronophilum]MCS3924414.1 hypothetical protein [Methanosalsum natronophilum]
MSYKKPVTLTASSGIKRRDTSTSIGGYYAFDTKNRFRYYQQLATATPHVSTSLNKLGLSLVKGMQFDGTAKKYVKEFEKWSRSVNFLEQIQTLSRLLCRDGTYIAIPEGNAEAVSLKPLYMPAVTIWPEGFNPKSSKNVLLTAPADKIKVNEGVTGNRVQEQDINLTDVIYGTYNAWDSVQKDIMDRETWGLYGTSLLDPIELSIRNLLNINSGYVSFVKKYGNSRYLINFQLLEKLVEQNLISMEDAQNAIDTWLEDYQYLSENEDIAAVGLNVIPIDSNGSLDVMSFKRSLEAEIQLGLFQTPLSMGDTKGSTYAAGYVSEADRMVVLEGLQHSIQNIVQQFINMRLDMKNWPLDSVWLEFEELSRPQMTGKDILDWYNAEILSKEQVLDWAGFSLNGKQ